jgi:Spy/CpxP family protein refolding chaperone
LAEAKIEMNKLKPLLALLAVFAAGTVFGVVGTRVVMRYTIRNMVSHPELVRERIELEMVRKLRLSPEQRRKVHQIMIETQSQLKDLRRESQPRFIAILSNTQAQISSVLTPEQRERFERLKEENRRLLPLPPPLDR